METRTINMTFSEEAFDRLKVKKAIMRRKLKFKVLSWERFMMVAAERRL